jgi:predicted  nucleic acid-binding Zn-ribbon protein
MTEYLTCKICGQKFGCSTIELMAGVVDCPNCGIPHANKYSPHIKTTDKHILVQP